jgi:hypothetical protein
MTTTTSTDQSASTKAERLKALAGVQLARDRWSRDQLLAFQGERLRAVIAHAAAASPYYRDLLGRTRPRATCRWRSCRRCPRRR